ncbi:MAG TPA: dihydrolipoamide acetyltransferase family protein [Pseudonocardiaceae bacterium]|jgi:pyruvate dehydrogenase E2 component (dihydrolipoamide acetyltransferase)|nr:dihydrolipoamide acetyltransferase family protein [Pseudonocardiaceae bacterium]
MSVFLLPDLGEGLTEAEIVGWRVKVGDTVTVDQVIVEVETAKAIVEVPVPFAGTVAELHGDTGDMLTVGKPLITVEDTPAAGFHEPGVVTSTPTEAGSEEGSGNVLIGYGTGAATPRRRRSRARAALARTVQQTVHSGRVPVVSPLVRRMAREAGLELREVIGSGPDGLITRPDVERAIAARTATPIPMPAVEPAAPEPTTEDIRRIPLRGIRKTVADKLSRSRREIPEATVWVDVDATGLLDVRSLLNTHQDEPKVSLLALVAKFAVLGLRRYPELNARIVDDEILMGDAVHLGFAAQTDRGLVVPVIPRAQELSVEQLSLALADRTRRARDGALPPAELTGGTFTVNNYGVFGVDGSAAIINHPEVAILGIGRIIKRPWVVDDEILPRSVTQLTLAFDHRVCDGGTAGGFLRFVADCVESPIAMLRQL